ncbi:ArsR/SmtB family transcription factor [Salinibacterium metalliresistens]|uniref:ArsR/SmtB family transcription factor n=1 Tax=Salinibacterium metalliresistens TaxID=3031321 RepID=UPI003B833CF6
MSQALAGLGASKTRMMVLEVLAESGELTVSELMLKCEFSRNGITDHLRSLTQIGIVKSEQRRRDWATKPVTHYWIEADCLEELAWNIYDELHAHVESHRVGPFAKGHRRS